LIIEIKGTNTWNKGAELMLAAIVQHFDTVNNVQLAVDQFFGTYLKKTKYDLLQKADIERFSKTNLAVNLLPESFRQSFGIVKNEEIGAILDASGFAFGDQHPVSRIINFANELEQATSMGKTIILLPQALGPFERPEIRNAFIRVYSAADLIFSRDQLSTEYAKKALEDHGKLYQYPDFTNQLKPILEKESNSSKIACIVPNDRMIEKAESDKERDEYMHLLKRIIRHVMKSEMEPVLLLHGEDDETIAKRLQSEFDALRLHTEDDPVMLKKFIGESHILIGSRFHALVSALSQSVPAVGTSWSHKYEMLFSEYDCPDLLLGVSASDELIENSIESVTQEQSRAEIRQRLGSANQRVSRKVDEMWKKVHALLKIQEPAE
jgi:colanic acid/amylovoran biosynthesis protein